MHYYSRLVFLSLVLACSHGQNSLDTVDLADTSNLPDIVNRAIKTCGSIRNLIDGRCPPNPNQPTVTPGPLAPAKRILGCGGDQPLKLVELSAPFYPGQGNGGAYGFASGTFEMRIVFQATRDIAHLGASAYGELPVLKNFDTKKQICEVPPNACRRARGGERCPIKAGERVVYRIPIPIRGNYYSGLPIDVRFQLFDLPQAPSSCLTNEKVQGLTPLVCVIIPAFIL